ncbi:MAG: hypothetical protein ACJ77K_15070 [Bacteroidia bacterium]
MKKIIFLPVAIAMSTMLFTGCSSEPENKTETAKTDSTKTVLPAYFDSLKAPGQFLTISLQPAPAFKLPAIHSFASAVYNGYWILIGGMKTGFHGTSNLPPPFPSSVANDSIWVISVADGRTWGVPVPAVYANYLSVTNPAAFQNQQFLNFCGGYTRQSGASKNFDCTSDRFFQINLANLITYVQSGGASPSLDQVIPVVAQSPYVQVTGGEMFATNRWIYIVGGQNYNTTYSTGVTGLYTNAIRRFTLQSMGGVNFKVVDTASYMDPVNLHRRDFTLAPVVTTDGKASAVLYGGVFTKNDMAYRNPVYISGWETGAVSIRPDAAQLNFNQYACAVLPMWVNSGNPTYLAFLGGISYQIYDPASKTIVTGDHGMPMPFSNVISVVTTDGLSYSQEGVQIPPQQPLMPGYLGSNAQFFPLSQYLDNTYTNMINLIKVFPTAPTQPVVVGYMFGGIRSDGPTSGTTPHGHVNTYPNPVLYSVSIGPAPSMQNVK